MNGLAGKCPRKGAQRARWAVNACTSSAANSQRKQAGVTAAATATPTVDAVHQQGQVAAVRAQPHGGRQARLGALQQQHIQLQVAHHLWVGHRPCRQAIPVAGRIWKNEATPSCRQELGRLRRGDSRAGQLEQ